jgi:hypothetical protein
MDHATEQMIGIADDLVAALALDMGNEADAAAVMLEIGMIEPPGHGPEGTVDW